jgi:hypothetical protein
MRRGAVHGTLAVDRYCIDRTTTSTRYTLIDEHATALVADNRAGGASTPRATLPRHAADGDHDARAGD